MKILTDQGVFFLLICLDFKALHECDMLWIVMAVLTTALDGPVSDGDMKLRSWKLMTLL